MPMTPPLTTMNPDPLRQHLQALPEPELSETLWPRLDGARQRRLDRQRRGAGALAIVLVALAVVPLLQIDLAAPNSAAANSTAAVVAVPRPEPTDIVAAGSDIADADIAARLRALDRDLQAAYREGSSDAEIAQLWQARRALLAGNGHASVANPIRI